MGPSTPDALDRRSLLAGAALLGSGFAGCLESPEDSAEALTGELVNDTEETVAVVLRLDPENGSETIERSWGLASGDYVEFRIETPQNAYHIDASVKSGPSTSVQWDGTPCQGGLSVAVEPDDIHADLRSC